jgi:hypothetical protein
MQIFIQNCKTKLFLREDLGWTEKMKEAMGFGSGNSALTFFQKSEMEDVQLVYNFGHSSLNFTTPVSASCR